MDRAIVAVYEWKEIQLHGSHEIAENLNSMAKSKTSGIRRERKELRENAQSGQVGL